MAYGIHKTIVHWRNCECSFHATERTSSDRIWMVSYQQEQRMTGDWRYKHNANVYLFRVSFFAVLFVRV